MVMSLSRVLWKVHSKAPTVTASMLGTVLAAGEGYTTIRDSTLVVLVSLSAIVSYKFKSTITDLQNQGHDIANLSLDGWTWFALALILVASILHVIFETARHRRATNRTD